MSLRSCLPLIYSKESSCEVTSADVVGYLFTGQFSNGRTGYRNLKKLPAGQNFKFTADHGLQKLLTNVPDLTKLLENNENTEDFSDKEIDEFRDILVESLERRLISDVPLSLLISSGMNSTLIACLLVYELQIKPHCYVYEAKNEYGFGFKINEAAQTKDFCKHLDLEIEVFEGDPDDLSPFEFLVQRTGYLTDNTGLIPIYQLTQHAARKHRVCLTGIGADEIFFSYGKTQNISRLEKIIALPKMVRDLLFTSMRTLSPLSDRAATISAHRFAAPSLMPIVEKNFPIFPFMEKELNAEPFFKEVEAWSEQFGNVSPSLLSGLYDLLETLPNSILPAMDFGSMSNSVELRSPYLSKALFDKVISSGAKRHIKMGRKRLLKALRERYVSEEQFPYVKRGFLFPLNEFLPKAPNAYESDLVNKEFCKHVFQKMHENTAYQRLAVGCIYLGFGDRLPPRMTFERINGPSRLKKNI